MSIAWVPVVDVSRHQGNINFAVMRNAGVRGVIFRATHGLTVDDRFDGYWRAAKAAGYTDTDLAVYTFVNPKRGSAVACARKLVEILALTAGHTRVGMMLDIESYAGQSPAVGETPVTGALFADYIRAMRAEIERLAEGYVFAYSNRSFWNGPTGPNDAVLAAELEWLVPRYPVYPPRWMIEAADAGNPTPLNQWVATSPKPPAPDQWDEWVFGVAPSGPNAPVGAKWLGWQFSADYNRQGPRYGCQSTNLDLNIVDPAAWYRWTHARQITEPVPAPTPEPTPTPNPEVPSMVLVSNAEPHVFTDGNTYPAGTVVWHLVNGELRHVTELEYRALVAAGIKVAARYTNAELSTLPRYGNDLVITGTFTGKGV